MPKIISLARVIVKTQPPNSLTLSDRLYMSPFGIWMNLIASPHRVQITWLLMLGRKRCCSRPCFSRNPGSVGGGPPCTKSDTLETSCWKDPVESIRETVPAKLSISRQPCEGASGDGWPPCPFRPLQFQPPSHGRYTGDPEVKLPSRAPPRFLTHKITSKKKSRCHFTK